MEVEHAHKYTYCHVICGDDHVVSKMLADWLMKC